MILRQEDCPEPSHSISLCSIQAETLRKEREVFKAAYLEQLGPRTGMLHLMESAFQKYTASRVPEVDQTQKRYRTLQSSPGLCFSVLGVGNGFVCFMLPIGSSVGFSSRFMVLVFVGRVATLTIACSLHRCSPTASIRDVMLGRKAGLANDQAWPGNERERARVCGCVCVFLCGSLLPGDTKGSRW